METVKIPATFNTIDSGHSGHLRRKADWIVVRATVELPNGCWSSPRLLPPRAPADAHAVAPIYAVAPSRVRPRVMCTMIVRREDVSTWWHVEASGASAS